MSVSEMNGHSAPAGEIAVIGAGGFVGTRLMHILRQHPQTKGIGIVRSVKSLARLSNTPLEVRVVDTSRTSELEGALADCETIVNSVIGDISRVLQETQAVHRAALNARCRLLIHLSSAVVF